MTKILSVCPHLDNYLQQNEEMRKNPIIQNLQQRLFSNVTSAPTKEGFFSDIDKKRYEQLAINPKHTPIYELYQNGSKPFEYFYSKYSETETSDSLCLKKEDLGRGSVNIEGFIIPSYKDGNLTYLNGRFNEKTMLLESKINCAQNDSNKCEAFGKKYITAIPLDLGTEFFSYKSVFQNNLLKEEFCHNRLCENSENRDGQVIQLDKVFNANKLVPIWADYARLSLGILAQAGTVACACASLINTVKAADHLLNGCKLEKAKKEGLRAAMYFVGAATTYYLGSLLLQGNKSLLE